MLFDTFEQTLTAGQIAHFPGGKRFVLFQAVYPVDLAFIDGMGHAAGYAKQIKGGFRGTCEDEDGKTISLSRIEVTSAIGQTVIMCVSNGEAVYDRSQGDVSIIGDVSVSDAVINRDDSLLYDSLQKNAFLQYYGYSTAVPAGSYQIVQLWNPSASGKKVYLSKITHSVNDSAQAMKGIYSRGASIAQNPLNGKNKFLGEAASSAYLQRTVTDTLASYTLWGSSDFLFFLSGRHNLFEFKPYIIIPPGLDICLIGATTINFGALFEWTERAV